MALPDPRAFPARPLIGVGAVVVGDAGVVLIKRGKPPRLGSWSLPGGAQKVGETVAEAARREIHEETGLEARVLGLVDVVDSITRTDDGRVEYHYTLIDVLAEVAADAVPVPGGDAADALWAPLDRLADFGLWSETERIIQKAHRLWRNPAGC